MSNYSTNNYNFPSTSLSRSTHGITENIYKTDFTKFSSDLGSLDSARPYVSAIRKRRTLFEDLQSGTGNQEALTNQYLIPQNYTTSQNTDSNEQYVVNRQQRPLSIVSEEAGYHPLTRSLSAKGDSRSFVDIQKISNIPDAANNSNSSKINRPPLKKSHSTASPQKSPVPSTNQQCDSSSNDAIPHTTVSAPQPKLRSTVFDRLAALNNNNTNSPKLSSQKSNSNLNLNLETPEITMKKSAKNIKDQNEIAIVTNMTPSTSKKDLSHYSSTNSTATLSRIRSLDSKSRDKLKNKDFLKKSQSSLTSNKMASSQKNLSETSKKLKSASSQLPPAAPTSSSHSNSTSPTPNNFNSNSNPSFKIDNSITSSNQTPATNSSTSTSAARSDVFERLSKRTNSMKNLSNNSINNANVKKINRSRNSPSSSDHDTDGKSSPTCSHMEDHSEISHNTQSTVSHSSNATNSLSKTSVFERLYKSNIAAHQSLKNEQLNHEQPSNHHGASLRKNMSNSTASLTSNTTASSLSRKSHLNTHRARSNLTRSKITKAKPEETDRLKHDDQEDQSSSSN